MGSVELVRMENGDEIEAIRGPDGREYIVPKRICENLGIDWMGQLTKLKGDHRSGIEIISTPDARGVIQQTCVIPVTRLAWWLSTINVNKVRPEIREKLELYQIEAADALDRHFRSNHQPLPAVPASPFELISQMALASHAMERRLATVEAWKTEFEAIKTDAEAKLASLPAPSVEAPGKSGADLAEQRIRFYCKSTNADYKAAYRRFYEEVRRRTSTDLLQRYHNNQAKYHSGLDVARELGSDFCDQIYAIACELFPLEPKIAI